MVLIWGQTLPVFSPRVIVGMKDVVAGDCGVGPQPEQPMDLRMYVCEKLECNHML